MDIQDKKLRQEIGNKLRLLQSEKGGQAGYSALRTGGKEYRPQGYPVSRIVGRVQ